MVIAWTVFHAATEPAQLWDTHAYWITSSSHPYSVSALGVRDAYLYSPAFLQVIAPLRMLPLAAFSAVIVVASAVAFYAMTGRLAGVVMLVFTPIFYELTSGNINLLLALAIVWSFRWPGLWSLVLLTKVTPGVGLLWFAVRREWRSLGIALGMTGVIAALSYVLVPGQWFDWIAVLFRDATHPSGYELFWLPLALRLPAAAILVVWGAQSGRRWTVVAAATLATPALSYVSISMLVGVVPLLRRPSESRVPSRRLVGSASAASSEPSM